MRWILAFYSPQRKFSTAVAVWRCAQGGAGRPEVIPAGFSGSGQRNLPVTPDVGNRGTTERNFGFVPIRGGGRLAELYAEPTTAGAAASGGQRQTVAGSAD